MLLLYFRAWRPIHQYNLGAVTKWHILQMRRCQQRVDLLHIIGSESLQGRLGVAAQNLLLISAYVRGNHSLHQRVSMAKCNSAVMS
mmetsp:Transcript_13679/g.18533  ORF Transcript_13679/g.18533 Transcript_13679/m.18533 type:complete len:86 (-) Transcript_13679:267-524(-)